MITKITQLISSINTSHMYHDFEMHSSLIIQKEMLIYKYVSEIKTILIEMKKSKEEETELFSKTFQDIVDNYGIQKYNFLFWSFPSTLVPHEHFGTITTASNLKFQVKISILKRLFFNDLLFYYYDFCYRMNEKFSEKFTICEINLQKIGVLLNEILERKTFSNEEIGLDCLMKLASGTFSLYEFTEMLESIVCEFFKIKKYTLQQILFSDSDLNKDTNLSIISKIERKYKLINRFIKNYNTSMTVNEKSCLWPQSTTCNPMKDSLLSFENKYLDSITLNITSEYKKRSQSPEDTRFKTYKKSFNIINSCKGCKNYCKDMLKNVRCDYHKNMLDTIRAEYFEFMKDYWLVDSILDTSRIYIQVFILAL